MGDTKKDEKKVVFSWLHPDIEVRDKPGMDKGLYAKRLIPAGTTIWKDSDQSIASLRYSLEEAQTWPKEEYDDWAIHAYQVGDNLFSGTKPVKGQPRDPSEHTNHSCDPNTWPKENDDDAMEACRDINPDEEVTYDYCTTESENSLHVKANWTCTCGAKTCRGKLTGLEYKDPDLKKRYENRWASYIQKKINKLKEEALKQKQDSSQTLETTVSSIGDQDDKRAEKKGHAFLHPYIEVRKSPIGGHGLFTTNKIQRDEIIFQENPNGPQEKVYGVEEILQFPEEKRLQFFHFAYQTSTTEFSAPTSLDNLFEDPGYFMNHSCDPTGWIVKSEVSRIVARRDIEKDEEITYDYATSESYEWPFKLTDGETVKCLCGTSLCRGAVRPNDWKRPDLRLRYKGHFANYLTDLIDQDERQQKPKQNEEEITTV